MEKKTTSDIINNFLDDDAKLRDTKTVIKLILAIGVIILYFGLKNTISLDALLVMDVGFLGVLGVIINKTLVSDFKNRAFYDEKTTNIELNKLDKEIEVLSIGFDDVDKCIEFVKERNDSDQERANKLVTNKKINYYKNKIRTRKIKGKRYKRQQRKLDFLQDNLIVDKKYKPINLNTLISIDNVNKGNSILGDKSINTNPKKGKWYMQSTTLLKFFGFGAGGGVAFLLTEWKLFITFTLSLILMTTYSCIQNYIKVRVKTSTSYLRTRQNKKRLMEEMRDYKVIVNISDYAG